MALSFAYTIKAPMPYRNQYAIELPDPNLEFHKRLMLLAPPGYSEPEDESYVYL
jgi:hypothetical protein